MKIYNIRPIRSAVTLAIIGACIFSSAAYSQQKPAKKSTGDSHYVEETMTPGASSDQAIVPTEHETVAFSMPGTGWLLGFQDIGKVKTVLEFVPAGHTIHDWREVVSFQTFQVVPDVTAEEFAKQIAEHWKQNCKNVDSSVLRKWKRDGYDSVLGVTDCSEASYSLVPEYMMYLIVRGKTRLHLVQRSVRGRDIKVDQDAWIKFFDAINVCPTNKDSAEKCLPKISLVEKSPAGSSATSQGSYSNQ